MVRLSIISPEWRGHFVAKLQLFDQLKKYLAYLLLTDLLTFCLREQL